MVELFTIIIGIHRLHCVIFCQCIEWWNVKKTCVIESNNFASEAELIWGCGLYWVNGRRCLYCNLHLLYMYREYQILKQYFHIMFYHYGTIAILTAHYHRISTIEISLSSHLSLDLDHNCQISIADLNVSEAGDRGPRMCWCSEIPFLPRMSHHDQYICALTSVPV